MRAPISNRDYERLSAYVDGQLNSREKNSLEESIKLRPDLQVELADLKRMKALLQMVPHRHAPRNFTLTQAMVGDLNKNRLLTRVANYFPAFSFASALATLALVASLLFQWLPAAQSLTASDPSVREVAMQPTTAQDSSMSGEEGALQLVEPPALLESADSAVDAESTAVGNLMEAPAAAAPEERQTANQVEATLPPMITWNNAGQGIGGYGITEENPSDLIAKGMGGGGGGTGLPGPVLAQPDGSIVVPLEGINSIEQPQPAIEAEPSPQEETTNQGTGPILGIPPADQGGEIADQYAWGAPSDEQLLAFEQAPESQVQTTSHGAPIWILQMLLAVVAIFSGVVAFYIRKQR